MLVSRSLVSQSHVCKEQRKSSSLRDLHHHTGWTLSTIEVIVQLNVFVFKAPHLHFHCSLWICV